MNLSDPFSLLRATIDISDPFTDGAKKIATFVKQTEERFDVPLLIRSLLRTHDSQKEREYALFCFLDVSRADFDTLGQATALRQLRHTVAAGIYGVSEAEDSRLQLLDTLRTQFDLATIDDVVDAARWCATVARRLFDGEEVCPADRLSLSKLLDREAEAMRCRTEWLSGHVDPYNMRAIARLLPLLTVCDEQAASLRELSERINRNDRLGMAVLTFEYAMRTDAFEKWRKKALHDAATTPFIELLEMQRERKIPLRPLIAVCTLARRLHSKETPSLTWIRYALESCTRDGFRMDISNGIDAVKPLLGMCEITVSGTTVSGGFSPNLFVAWTGIDMLTKAEHEDLAEPSPKELVARCMNNDALLLRLLENPRIFGAPGVVAMVAYTSRSLSVLHKIAITTPLHTGHANAGVPLALLKNPSHIPINLIRHFINTRYVSLTDMKEILRNPYGIRQEIFNEVKIFVGNRYS